MNDKNKLIIAIAIVVLVLGGGGYYVMTLRNTSLKEPSKIQQAKEEVYQTLSKDELGLVFTLRSDKRAAKFEISNVEDIDLVEYQITYTKELNGEEIPEGLIGETKKKPGERKIGIDYREFGTCSSGVCRYDKVVSDIKLLLKITKKDGSIFSAEDLLAY